ncbi:unnamed protein product [Ceutorhynchus assimilis]|uniref:C2H2-type domain-containing protein n=1 Tax=Ceutorhynchus assimilis TaxID=467358 RepID=A0A9N9QL38_9CUCU|nr:unnamed protein product [Ceutorhynchus assimilis]
MLLILKVQLNIKTNLSNKNTKNNPHFRIYYIKPEPLDIKLPQELLTLSIKKHKPPKMTLQDRGSLKLYRELDPQSDVETWQQCPKCPKQYLSKKLFELHKYFHKIQCQEALMKVDSIKNEFICTFCEVQCDSMNVLESHLLTHEEVCKACEETFPNAFVLGVHLAEHDIEERMCCPFCDYKGIQTHCLRTHLLTKHFKLKIFRCEECGATYSAKTHFEEHVRYYHDKMDPYACIVCQRTFIFASSLKKHQVNNHRPLIDGDVPSNYCIICKRTLSTVEALKKHVEDKHLAQKPPKNLERFVCDICGKDFSHRQSWLLHTKGHSGLKPYKCNLCPKTFRCRAFLTQHEKIHSDEKPFSCEICGTCFKRKEGLRRHLICHTDVKPFECHNCEKTFRRREHLRLHLNSCNRNMAGVN